MHNPEKTHETYACIRKRCKTHIIYRGITLHQIVLETKKTNKREIKRKKSLQWRSRRSSLVVV